MDENIALLMLCTCGIGFRLGLTMSEQKLRILNDSTGQIVNLFKHFHGKHGTVRTYFSDEQQGFTE